MKSDRPPVVAILMDTSLQGGRNFVMEVANWARTHGPWRLIMREGGGLAANYYLERRYRSFAYVGDTIGTRWSRKRQEGFADTLAQAKFTCAIYPGVSEAERLDWMIERPRMIAWLQGLKKPVGVFAAMDGRARLVLDACATAGIGVPEEVSVLGVDNDVTLSEWRKTHAAGATRSGD